MRLTRYTDYALRVLIYLGLRAPEDLSKINEIARTYGISENHLMKVVHRLGQKGFVETVRGRQGGIRLAHSPASINIGDVVRKCEDDLRLVECFDLETNTCVITGACVLPAILDDALAAFLDVLDRYTLEDLLKPGHALTQLLPPPSAHDP